MSEHNLRRAGPAPDRRHRRRHLTVAGRVPAELVDESAGVRPPPSQRRSVHCIQLLGRRVFGALRRRVGN